MTNQDNPPNNVDYSLINVFKKKETESRNTNLLNLLKELRVNIAKLSVEMNELSYKVKEIDKRRHELSNSAKELAEYAIQLHDKLIVLKGKKDG